MSSPDYSSEKEHRLENREAIQVLFVSFLNLAVLLSFPGCRLYVQMSFILKTHTEGRCFVVVTAKSPSLLQRLLIHVFPFIS